MATRLHIIGVTLMLHLALLVCIGCNSTKKTVTEAPAEKTAQAPTLKERFGRLELLDAVDVPTGQVARGFAISPADDSVAVGGGDGSIVIVGQGGKPTRTLNGHREAVLELAYTPDGSRLVSGGADNQLVVWNPTSGEVIVRKKKAHNGDIKALAVSPDGALVASGSVDDTLKVWRTNTLELPLFVIG